MSATRPAPIKLSELLRRDVAADPLITGVTADSRKVAPGSLFVALPGSAADGRAFIPQALSQGAAAILAPADTDARLAPLLVTSGDVRRAYAIAARGFYGSQPATCVAITGTNGKTSVAAFCRQIWASLGLHSASMGTLGVLAQNGNVNRALTGPGLTSPDAGDAARMLADLAESGVTHLALEASSHGIDQRRLDGVTLQAAAFTNLSQDHLDYHGDMAAYRDAKLRLFDTLLPRGRTAVLNADSDAYSSFAAASIMSGLGVMAVGERGRDLALIARRAVPEGQRLTLDVRGDLHEVLLPLAGAFQASNALVAAGLCIAAGETPARVLAALETITGAPGRLQRIPGSGRGEVYVDYAHTPDGLETVLKALRPHATGRLIVVFGAGGDRDRAKRPMMGEIAGRLADVAIVTDDNPRSEDPAVIRKAVRKGCPAAQEIGDRRVAIREAIEMMGDGDVVIIAGKGHEQGQIVGGVTHPFDDATEAAEALRLHA
ncbi:MAG: UDP-N-acetylmuramoyl-L-alanyl-D-glutamate--2,6-diaminopimelate ligase [Alphaproteobacteria bacterium]|uniref:UDP-N-acetylmuramoyl-L-alanyl-D-glutamate--2, 6-diaminopimelate ligase n=1 Tax=Brevundimonas sp. TaxID=1871086 RepID=UPI00185CD438|nr:UDP-N-acetylmuramoyl-L-alanyl-D-glutamate--2,6-diaminopimelate ligase [Brevundimonas sp.]MBA3048976.1 UDP-N-acetylmuramoyl-L-alanyl-D-glutamate--2,6-diaminopimelate ligase [Brevundimonas sp.]MBU3972264.1 UDP-N-acetylmuramoyl-L-alanyl-D-glutamate--2,6-diaminopimelate ligase [Alphaproteobacteria bacterium]MBU4137662.1 UDP-N-acetylmuramoyl-L-alanyl-D-glutamate--2,6-diaminopimelate ligase [Alphaproteobacteria bacterium]